MQNDVTLLSVSPSIVLPGTTVVLAGGSFLPSEMGPSVLHLSGSVDGQLVQLNLPARYISEQRAEVDWPGSAALGISDGRFEGRAHFETDETDQGTLHRSSPVSVSFEIRSTLSPRLDNAQQGMIFVNDPIVLEGQGFLLGGGEGKTTALLEGCFRPQGQSDCSPIASQEIDAPAVTAFDRTRVSFAFLPKIAGIQPGSFEGQVRIRTQAPQGQPQTTDPQSVSFELVPTAVLRISPDSASLGQYVDVYGGGFVGSSSGDVAQGITTLELLGSFTATGSSNALPVRVSLVPEFSTGQLVRYVLNEEDSLGQAINLRQMSGVFSGTIQPTVQYQSSVLTGNKTPIEFTIAPVKQLIWLRFLPAYVASLRHFGLRAVDAQIRQRVFEAARRDYRGINVEFRAEIPTDFAAYAQVDLSGPDANGLGLLGYDNTRGKDVNNARLHDKIGGLNASTLEDGSPGYGGVFVESFFCFSEHPGPLAKKIDDVASPVFDQIFDPFRPDLGGHPVVAEDLAHSAIPELTSSEGCPAVAGDRPKQIACAIWALGSMIGTTMTHEVAHSLGLADPYGTEFHNPGDVRNRLMDGGAYRTFLERAELQGEGPGIFCDEDYAYLKIILPSAEPDPLGQRPTCSDPGQSPSRAFFR